MKRSAGLPLSVGRASVATRVFLAIVFLTAAVLCIGGGGGAALVLWTVAFVLT